MEFRPHDLLRIDPNQIDRLEQLPPWCCEAVDRTPYVVARRALCDDPGQVAVGIRGQERHQRCAATISRAAVSERVAPEDLVARIPASQEPGIPLALAALPNLKAALAEFVWGPAGSVGFYLATGADCVSYSSDLDLIVRCGDLPSEAAAHRLFAVIRKVAANADVLLELPGGAVVLEEYVRSARWAALRTVRGPQPMNESKQPCVAEGTEK